MRRLALLLVLGISALSVAAPDYLKLRAQNGIVQAVGAAALREVVKPRVLELQGKILGSCQSGDATILIFQHTGGDTQEIEAKAPPEWLADPGTDVRLLVRCARAEKGGALRSSLLAAAPELDVLPVEEAYWRGLAAARRSAAAAAKPVASRHATTPRSTLYGAIGRPAARRDWNLAPSEVTPYYTEFIRNRNRRLSASQAQQIAEGVVGFSGRYNVDARLVMAMLIVESGINPNAVSRAGAVGLGQLMPGTARWMGVRNAYDSMDNLSGMVRLLRTHMNQYRTGDGSNPLVLAAYNAGAGAVARHGGVPPYRETQNYVRKVTAIYRKLCGL